MEKKSNIIAIILLVVGILFILSSYLLSTFSNEEEINEELNFQNIEIKNSEIENLFSYVIPDLYSSSPCLGLFYHNPFKNYSLDDKISLLLNSYGINFIKDIDDEFLNKISDEEIRSIIKDNSLHYIEVNTIKEAMKLVFNIELDNYEFKEDKNYYNYRYRKDVDAFMDISIDKTYEGQILQQIIDYNENKNEISITIVKAEIISDNIAAGAYRYANKKDTLVIKDVTDDDFSFTEDNIDLFPQLKYVFKKNNNGKYYVSDIINLNFEEDFEKCN